MNRAEHKLFVIVPYKNREQHLREFVEVMPRFLGNKGIDYELLIIQQDNQKEFRKGVLLNAGYKEASKLFNEKCIPYFAFHDIDTLPIDPSIDYSFCESLCHLYGQKHCLGGIVLVNQNTFIDLNGYSNNYYGWGMEDVDFQFRAQTNNITIDRRRFIERKPLVIRTKIGIRIEWLSQKFRELPHLSAWEDCGSVQSFKEENPFNGNYYNYCLKNPERIQADGLNNCAYHITKIREYDDYKIISIDYDESHYLNEHDLLNLVKL